MNIFTVSFFGHREIERPLEIQNRLEKHLHDIINREEYIEFLIGRDGDFDILAASAIKHAIRKYGHGNTNFILVLPYMKADYHDNEKCYLDYYDEVEICGESARAHYKSAIQVRNKNMIDRSDLVICYVEHESGGAYKSIQYAAREGREIINIAKDEL